MHTRATEVGEHTLSSERGDSGGQVSIEDLSAYYGKFRAVKGVSLEIDTKRVTAIIGPSGCGKSTLLRCINRMHEEAHGARVSGKVLLNGEDIYDKEVDA